MDIFVLDDLDRRVLETANEAVWLFWLDEPDFAAFGKLLPILADSRPLLVMVCGPLKEAAFEMLLDHLGEMPAGPHIMSKKGTRDLSSSVEELLISGWPAEDRFDSWKRHAIAIPKERWEEAEAALEGLCDSS